ncbi:MAG: HNH endonuclease [Chloroflexota bacterium]
MPAKPKSGRRAVDRRLVDWVLRERDGACLYGWFYQDRCPSQALHVHHIRKRSQMGDDHPANLITLCVFHHDQAERHIITPERLLHILAATGAGKETP